MKGIKASHHKSILCGLMLWLLAAQVAAQVATGGLSGWILDESGARLPGVTLTATSPNLQGSRVTTSDANGSYKLVLLPPGTYTVTYELEGFATAVRQVKINAGLTTRSDPIQMVLSQVQEEIMVTGELETISKTPTGAATFEAEEIHQLPINRDLKATTLMAPGVHAVGPEEKVTISGAASFFNLFLMNGVILNDNIWGQPYDLFIEDAILETTVSASGISAEYGRFSGGVVNAITKSGGNRFEGSLRATLNNNDWEAKTPLSAERKDEIVPTYEATLGGYFWKDHLWFFGAYRDRGVSETQTTRAVTNIPFDREDTEKRYEAKLTVSPHPGHNVILSYFEIDEVERNQGRFTFLDLRSLTDRKLPQEMIAGNYTGILTPKFFIEAQYSEREFFFEDSGAKTRDLLEGTLMRRRGTSHRWHSPTFCGAGPPECPPEERSNTNLLAKGSYFLTSEQLGSHEVVFGYDTFDDIRFSINRQTGSDFTVWASDIIVDPNNNIYSQFNGSDVWIGWWAVFNEDLARPTSFTTNSFFVNDSWQLNDHWSFNLGVRYDKNDGQNSAGVTTADDAKWSPRLGLSYDVKGDGDLVIHGSYGSYVAPVGQSGDITEAGAIGEFLSEYGGPTVNVDPACADRGDCVSTQDALAILFDWYFQNGTKDEYFEDPSRIPGLFYISIPGTTVVMPETLRSSSADELAIGVTKRLGSKGLLRADLVYREWNNFYSLETELGNIVETSAGPVDVALYVNSNAQVREYLGLHTQCRYRVSDRLNVAGNYTFSRLQGNTPENGPGWALPEVYPEYKEPRWNHPEGDLSGDQRHKLRAWAIYDILDWEHHNLGVSWLENFWSGSPYAAAGKVSTLDIVGDLGYASVRGGSEYVGGDPFTYFFTARDAFRTDSIHRSDFSLNYGFRWTAWGRQMEVFLQPEVLNVFNEQGVWQVNTDVADATQAAFVCPGGCQPFNPFTETPVEGVHWAKREGFGRPEDELGYQLPRTFRVSVGFRF